MGEALFRYRPFKPLVKNTSRYLDSTLINTSLIVPNF
jgi:hypothetical protein